MGMAASQARLLSIIARQHDVELKAQQIQAAKIQLAIQSDAAYQKYNEALDASTLTVNALNMQNGTTSTQVATFANLTGINAFVGATGQRYALHDKNGSLLMSEYNYNEYQDFKGNTAQEFAMYMMDETRGTDANAIQAQEKAIFESKKHEDLNELGAVILESLKDNDARNGQKEVDDHNAIEQQKFDADYETYLAQYEAWAKQDEETRGEEPVEPTEDDYDFWEDYEEKTFTDVYSGTDAKLTEEEREMYNQQMEEFSALAQKYFTEDNYKAIVGEDAFDREEFDYYCDLYVQIQNSNGVAKVESTQENNSDWLTNMVKSGQISISTWKDDQKTDTLEFDMESTSPSSDSGVSYTSNEEIDKAAMKKAEAEYEHTLKQIDAKDKKFDMELAKLDTERKALTTMYDSVKKVIDENVERNFGIFS